jgi:hypothetical protein
MAVLSDPDRFELWAAFMQEQSGRHADLPLTKAELRAAVDALDDFLNANAAAINSAIPQPARGALSASQKALLLEYVIQRRYVKGA